MNTRPQCRHDPYPQTNNELISENMCIGSITRMTCGHLHIIFHDRCVANCKEPKEGPRYHDQEQQCGNCEASNEIYDIRDDYQKKYDEAMPHYKLAHSFGNVEELERIRIVLGQHAREENRMVSAVRRAGRAKARPKDSDTSASIHPNRGHDPMAYLTDAQDAFYCISGPIPCEIKEPIYSPVTSSNPVSPATPSPVPKRDPLHYHPKLHSIDLSLHNRTPRYVPHVPPMPQQSPGQPATEVDSGLYFVGFNRNR
ncbi:hypothetical protein QBC38DRAFT_235565 [Podospora fimiseda]|uniref:Uncharacterized protein n=1 Tax=Podospora fimiseda TaxID=252190 RepID=A0AAN7BMU0_9PEZI|nr:hypothetical protein QBC38DRAFT_235565 [Podospora fimiseda]